MKKPTKSCSLYNPHTDFIYMHLNGLVFDKVFIDGQLIRSDNGNYVETFNKAKKS